MSTLIESLRRLFLLGKITADKLLQQMQADGKITADELTYITAAEPSGELAELQQYYKTTQAILPDGEVLA